LTADLTAKEADKAQLPVVDLAKLGAEEAGVRASEARALRAACTGSGFFYLSGHGVPQAVVADVFEQAHAFFDLPLADKMALDVAGSPVMRGYSALLAENTDVGAKGDVHEAFDIGGVLYDGAPGEAFNRYPARLPTLEPVLGLYWAHMLRLSRDLMGGFALALGLPQDHFAPMLAAPQAFLRILHYPPQNPADAGGIDPSRIGIGAHSDYESLTILAQDDNRALQISDGEGGWIWATPLPGAFVVNIGDQMARWTNDLFRSTVHRAINLTGRRRYSIPFFFGPDPATVIEALPGCVGPAKPALYPPITAGDYSRLRMAASYSPQFAAAAATQR
jgi:isopenicillin N synthase-like dioxygenase